MGRKHQGLDKPGVRQVPEGSGEQGKMEITGCKITCCAPTTVAVKGLMMMMMMMIRSFALVENDAHFVLFLLALFPDLSATMNKIVFILLAALGCLQCGEYSRELRRRSLKFYKN